MRICMYILAEHSALIIVMLALGILRPVVALEPGAWVLRSATHKRHDFVIMWRNHSAACIAAPPASVMHAGFSRAALACTVPAAGVLVITFMHTGQYYTPKIEHDNMHGLYRASRRGRLKEN
jgi:hypothetical protein